MLLLWSGDFYTSHKPAMPSSGGLENTNGDDDLGMMDADSLPGPHAHPVTQQPWTQQPSEAQLPQTQQHFSALPSYEVGVVLCWPMGVRGILDAMKLEKVPALCKIILLVLRYFCVDAAQSAVSGAHEAA